MRKRSKGFALARNTGSPLKISGVIAQPARPRSTASELYTSQPCFTKKFNQPSRPSGVVSYVTPVSPPPCHIKSGTAPRRFAGRKYCTYIASTEYVPFKSTFAGTPPGVNTTSFTGLPEISTSRPPTWNEPMSRKAIGSAAFATADVATVNAAASITLGMRDMIPPRVACLVACLVPCILRRFPSGDPSEHAADGHAHSGRVAFAQHIAGHDLAGGEHVGRRLAVLHQHARLLVHAGAEIGEGDAGPHRVGIIRRRLDLPRPMRLRRREALGAVIVKDGVIEGAGAHRRIEVADSLFQRRRIELEFAGQLGDRAGLDRREQRRHETVARTRVEDDVGDLVWLGCDEATPDRVALRPDVFALVVKPFGA